jgi:hypothetical protein
MSMAEAVMAILFRIKVSFAVIFALSQREGEDEKQGNPTTMGF